MTALNTAIHEEHVVRRSVSAGQITTSCARATIIVGVDPDDNIQLSFQSPLGQYYYASDLRELAAELAKIADALENTRSE